MSVLQTLIIPVRGGRPEYRVDVMDMNNKPIITNQPVPFDLEIPRTERTILSFIIKIDNKPVGTYSFDSKRKLEIIRLHSFQTGGAKFHCEFRPGTDKSPCCGGTTFSDVIHLLKPSDAADLCSAGDFIYAVFNKGLYRITPDLGQPERIMDNWSTNTIITALNDQVFAVHNDSLYRVDIEEGTRAKLAEGWSNPQDLAACGDHLVAIYDNKLWKVDPRFGTSVQIGTDSWNNDQRRLATLGDDLYATHHDKLWKVDVDSGSREEIASGWGYTCDLVSHGNHLYAGFNHNGDSLWRVDPVARTTELWGQNHTNWHSRYTVHQGRLYTMNGDGLLSLCDLHEGVAPQFDDCAG